MRPKGFRRPRLPLCARRDRPPTLRPFASAPTPTLGSSVRRIKPSVSGRVHLAFYGLICLADAVTTSRKTTFSIFVRETSALRSLGPPPSIVVTAAEDVAERRASCAFAPREFLPLCFLFLAFPPFSPFCCISRCVSAASLPGSTANCRGTGSSLPPAKSPVSAGENVRPGADGGGAENASLVENDHAFPVRATRAFTGGAEKCLPCGRYFREKFARLSRLRAKIRSGVPGICDCVFARSARGTLSRQVMSVKRIKSIPK